MSEEQSTNDLFKKMLHRMMEEDPKMAMVMLMTALKAPALMSFVEENAEKLKEPMTITITSGGALFLFSACLETIGNMACNQMSKHSGQFNAHILKDYAGVGMTFAELVKSIGYPESSAVRDMAGAIGQIDHAFAKAEIVRQKLTSGERSIDDIDDLIKEM